MRWHVCPGDILDQPADVLVCSANPFLTLSGGVGGAMLLRYGPGLQDELNAHLTRLGRRSVERGEVVVTRPANTPYKAVLHAVAVNAFYESSPAIVAATLRAALRAAAAIDGARTIALTALATGYGRLGMAAFGEGVAGVVAEEFPPLTDVTVVVRRAAEAELLRAAVAAVGASRRA